MAFPDPLGPTDPGSPLDPGIKRYVEILREHGVFTIESCQGGEGHAYPDPVVRFSGQRGEGFRALAVAFTYQLPVSDLRRVWNIVDGEVVGPDWYMTFYKKAPDATHPTSR